jgi:hypothetical protein
MTGNSLTNQSPSILSSRYSSVHAADQHDIAHYQGGGMEARLHNWAAWKRKEPLADATDAKTVDGVIQTLGPDDRAAITAVYVSHPYQSIYYVSAEIHIPPTWINRAIEKAKRGLSA